MSLSLMITVVSSAYNMQNNILDTLQMAFMYIMNDRGSRIDPCGIPHLIVGSMNVLHQKQHTAIYLLSNG